MGSIAKHCQMCAAAPGEPCTHTETVGPEHVMVRNGHMQPQVAGDVRSDVHWARSGERPYAILIPDEPPYVEAR